MDNCCFNRPYDDQNQIIMRIETDAKLNIQSSIKQKNYALIWSFMLDFENNDNPYDDNKQIIQSWEKIATEFCDFDEKILEQGKELQKLGIKENDSLHIACAIFTNCEYFITTDYKLTTKDVEKIKIINL